MRNRKSASPHSLVKADTSKTNASNEWHPTSHGMNERKCERALTTIAEWLFNSDRLLCLKPGVLFRKRKS